MRIHCAQVQHYYLKIPGVMLRRLSISRKPLQEGQLRPVPMVSFLQRVDCIRCLYTQHKTPDMRHNVNIDL